MTITQGFVNQAKIDLFGVHGPGDTYKIALYVDTASIGPSTDTYTSSGEVANGNGYTTGGKVLTGFSASLSGTTGVITFDDPSWESSTITARGFMIYNASKSNKALMVGDFGESVSSIADTFSVTFPTADATNGLIRIA